jgi:hypothetical protein
MLVRIVKQPPHETVDGVVLDSFKRGGTYEVATALAEYLTVCGCGVVEVRGGQRSKRVRTAERRTANPSLWGR